MCEGCLYLVCDSGIDSYYSYLRFTDNSLYTLEEIKRIYSLDSTSRVELVKAHVVIDE